MTDPVPTEAEAEAERVAAHARLQSTIALLKARAAPRSVASRAVDRAKSSAIEGKDLAVDTVRNNPAASAGILAAVVAVALGGWGLRRRRRKVEAPTPASITEAGPGGRSSTFRQSFKERDK